MSNPFDDDGPVDPYSSGKVRKNKHSGYQYDFDASFDSNKSSSLLRRGRSDDRESIISGVDADILPARKPSVMQGTQRASTVGAEMKRFSASILGMQGPAGVNFDASKLVGSSNKSVGGPAGSILVTKKKIPIALWPYDDYHLTQKMFYEKLEEKEAKGDSDEQGESVSSIPIFSRPNDPPEVRHAVVGLPLTEFEAKAEERGISLVSTWLFDAGLIDELLVNGGMSRDVLQSNDNSQGTDSGEGVEVGALGHPIEGSNKMDKEIAKLRSATKRHLTLINSRLNDGVAASGSEVQELVNAVNSTKDDLGRLRELSTYVSNASDVEKQNDFMIQNYPHLKKTVNARRNLNRCFRELGFFSQIPDTCERLREQLYAGEYTAHEWTNLRDVCREHVELEIFLVEAEVGMKARLQDHGEHKSHPPSIRGKSFGRQAFLDMGLVHNSSEVDHFLKEHVKNVWELGDEIRIRLLSGIGAAFDLSRMNPAGMVALVEAVEVYEIAADEYKTVHGVESGSIQNLRFTDMRSAALSTLYKDMEVRGLDIFKDIVMQAADNADEEDATNQEFSSVLRAAGELMREITFVKNQMAPCFPSYWAIETIWTTSVAHLCSHQILQQIGGQEGHKLCDLTVTQLLGLVAFVESFRGVVEDTFPDLGNISTSKTYFDRPPELLMDGNKSVDVKTAKDSLAWVNNTLWLVHDSAKDEFLYRTKDQIIQTVENIYANERETEVTGEGKIYTLLCQDIFGFVGVQLKTIRDHLTRRSEAMVQSVGVIVKTLYDVQVQSRDKFLTDFETCCAASNDFLQMSEAVDDVVAEIRNETSLSPVVMESLQEQSAALIGLYSADAVYAGQKTHVYIFEPIEEAITVDLFGVDWLETMTNNELALTLVRTVEDFMEDLENFLDEFMIQKVVEALVSASVIFYIRSLLGKASLHKSNRDSFFADNRRALDRMSADVAIMKEYFDEQAKSMASLKRIIDREFEVLETFQEMIAIAAGLSQSDPHDFILVLQKRIRNITITKLIVGDIYHLVQPSGERSVYELVDSMEEEMMVMAPTDERAVAAARERSTVPGLRLDQMMAKHCDQSKRKRPFKSSAVDRTEKMLQGWRATWSESTAAARKTHSAKTAPLSAAADC